MRKQGLYPKNPGPASPWEIFAKLSDSLAPELLQLLTPEFRIVRLGNFRQTTGFSLATDNCPMTTAIRSQIFVAAAFVFQTMEFDVGGYERTVT
jgi:hypothetical protein